MQQIELPRQESYLLQRQLQLTADVDAHIRTATRQVAARTYEWDFRIWSPKRWKISEINHSYSRSFTVDKYLHRTTTSKWPTWRLRHIGMRFAYYANNGLFVLLANCLFGPFVRVSCQAITCLHLTTVRAFGLWWAWKM